MLNFYVDDDFSKLEPLLTPIEDLSFCCLNGKCAKEKFIFFQKALAKAKQNAEKVLLLWHPFLKNQPVLLCLPLHSRILLDADYFSILSPKDTPMGKSSLFLHTDHCFPSVNLKKAKSYWQDEETFLYFAKEYALCAESMRTRAANLLSGSLQKSKIFAFVLEILQEYVTFSESCSALPIQYFGSLSGFSSFGKASLFSALLNSDTKILLLQDHLSLLAPIFLRGLAAGFSSCGYPVFLFQSIFKNMPQSLFVPKLNLLFSNQEATFFRDAHPSTICSLSKFLPLHAVLEHRTTIHTFSVLEDTFLSECDYALLEAEEARATADGIVFAKKDDQKEKAMFSFMEAFLFS